MKTPLNNEELRTIVDSLYDGVWIADKDGTALYANKSSLQMFGVTEREIIGKKAAALVEKGVSTYPTALETALAKKTLFKVITSKTGKNIEQVATPVFDNSGNVWRIAIINRYFNKSFTKELNTATIIPSAEEVQESAKLGVTVSSPVPYITASQDMGKIMSVLQRAAQSDATVMILGESGVGKDGLAYHLHAHSARKQHPLVIINCATIPHNLIESELFGYEKGAFTDAASTRIGLFEQANHGSIFLDEVGDLPLPAQVKLLRCIQNREILRLGGKNPIKLDIRFITATNRSLERLVENGEFRQDLYYRLNVIKIEVPPLRQRRADIAPLAKHFLDSFNAKYKSSKRLSGAAMALLERYGWPGNVRELENALECAVVLCPFVIISPEYLPESLHQTCEETSDFPTLKEARTTCEHALIRRVLQAGHSLREAAHILRVDHSTLVRKMQKGVHLSRNT